MNSCLGGSGLKPNASESSEASSLANTEARSGLTDPLEVRKSGGGDGVDSCGSDDLICAVIEGRLRQLFLRVE